MARLKEKFLIRNDNTKIYYWQVIRAISIIAVIIIHTSAASTYKINSPSFNAWFIVRGIVNFTVALFFFISAYFFNIEKYEKNKFKYIFNKIIIFFVSFLFWSIIYFLIDSLLKGSIILNKASLVKILLGKTSGHLYYLIVLIQLIILTPLLINIIRKNNWLTKILYLITPLSLIGLYAFNILTKSNLPNYIYYFVFWFFFYHFGLNVRIHKKKILAHLRKYAKPILIIIFLMLSILESYLIYFYTKNKRFSISQVTFFNYIYTFFIITFLIKIENKYIENKDLEEKVNSKFGKTVLRMLINIGDLSYGIYLLHFIPIILLRRKFFYLVHMPERWILRFMVLTIVTLISTWFVVVCLKFIFRKLRISNITKYIGL